MLKIYHKVTGLLLKIIPVLILFLGISKDSQAQWGGYHTFAADWELNLNLGMTSFYGDLTDNKNRLFTNTPFNRYFYQDREMVYGVLLKKHISRTFSIRGEFNHGKLKSNPSSYDLHFNSKFNEYYLGAELNIANLFRPEKGEHPWDVYVYTGLGVTDYRTWLYDDESGELLDRQGYGESRWFDQKPKMATAFTIPSGMGVSYRLSDEWALNFETSINLMVTDKMDAYNSDVSGIEGYGITSLGISYYFHLPWNLHTGRYHNYKGRSSEPALEKYNKKRRVVMKTKAYRKARKHRYKNSNFIRRIINWFRQRRHNKR